MDYRSAPDLTMALEDLDGETVRTFFSLAERYPINHQEPFGNLKHIPGPRVPEAITERLTPTEARYLAAGIWIGKKEGPCSLGHAVDAYIQAGKAYHRSHYRHVNGDGIRPLTRQFSPLDRAFAHAMIATTKTEFVDLCERIAVMLAHRSERHPDVARFHVLLSMEPLKA